MSVGRELFFDRQLIVNEIVRGALAPQPASFSLVGPRLSGKSTLLHWLATAVDPWSRAATGEQTSAAVVLLVDCAWVTPTTLFDQIWGALVAQMPAEQAAANADSFQALWRVTQQLASTQRRLVLLLDNFDIFWQSHSLPAQVNAPLHRLNTVATLVLATTQPLADLDEGGAAMALGVQTQLFLGLFDCAAAAEWLAHYQQKYPGLETVRNELLTLTGRHPYLLRKLGDSLVEVQHILAGQPLSSQHAPLLRLRLAEHARPLFAALWQQIETQSGPLQPTVHALLDRLMRSPLPVDQVRGEQVPALNWLINQAVISYSEHKGGAVYQLFSPLLADFIGHRRLVALPSSIQVQAVPVLSSSEQLYEQLSKMEVALLRYFEKHSQRLVTMDQLLAEVWKRPASSTRRVQEAIRRLRLQLEQQTPPIGAIENERGRGYRFVPAQNRG